MIWSLVYLICVLFAQYTATWFIPFPWFGLLSFGTILFGVTFTARDYVHRLGRKHVYMLIAIAVLGSIVETFILGVPWRIILGSAIAIAISETTDTEIYQKLLSKKWFVRVLVSNSASVPTDTILFTLIAFYGVFPMSVILQIIFADIVAKYIVGVVIGAFRYFNPSFQEVELEAA